LDCFFFELAFIMKGKKEICIDLSQLFHFFIFFSTILSSEPLSLLKRDQGKSANALEWSFLC